MTQGAQPVIHGAEWTPSEALTFTQPLLIDAARAEVMRFFLRASRRACFPCCKHLGSSERGWSTFL